MFYASGSQTGMILLLRMLGNVWRQYLSQQEGVLLASSVKSESHSVVSDSLQPHGLYSPWNSPGQNTGVGSLSLLQGIFPTQESNQGLLHCRWILDQLSYQGSPDQGWWKHPAGHRTVLHNRFSQLRMSVVRRMKPDLTSEYKHWG